MKTLTLSLATFTSSITFASAATKVCQNYKIPLTVTSENFVYDMPYFADNYDVVDWISNFGSRTASVDYHPFSNTKQNQTASYTISATFCTPKDPEAAYKDTVLFATHGLNFDNRCVLLFGLFFLIVSCTNDDTVIGPLKSSPITIALLTTPSIEDTQSSITIDLGSEHPLSELLFLPFDLIQG